MLVIKDALNHFFSHHSIGYIAIIIVMFILFDFLISRFNNGIGIFILLVCSAIEAFFLWSAWNSDYLWLLILFIAAAGIHFFLQSKEISDTIYRKIYDSIMKSQFMKAMKSRDFQRMDNLYNQYPNNVELICQIDDPQLLAEIADHCSKSNSINTKGNHDKRFYYELAKKLDRKTAVRLLNSSECNISFRLELFDIRSKDIDFSNIDWLLPYKQVLEKHLDILIPKIPYPKYAEYLREVATNVLSYDLSIRKKAYERLPKTDEAFTKEYCKYCGSTNVSSYGYLGLFSDMYYYGYRCNHCGKTSGSPQGMGEPAPLAVSLSELMEK